MSHDASFAATATSQENLISLKEEASHTNSFNNTNSLPQNSIISPEYLQTPTRKENN